MAYQDNVSINYSFNSKKEVFYFYKTKKLLCGYLFVGERLFKSHSSNGRLFFKAVSKNNGKLLNNKFNFDFGII